MPFDNPLICALDSSDLDETVALARGLSGSVGGLKLGLQFLHGRGPAGVRAVADAGLPLFLDVKLHDIPNTVAGAVRSLCVSGPAMFTVMAQGGATMMRAAVAAAADAAGSAGDAPPWVLAVTVLTSLDGDDLAATGVAGTVEDQVLRLADLALGAGCSGLVCSPLEIEAVRRRFGAGPRLVVPGIRPEAARDDQKRTMTPADALAAGADLLVVGRPITGAADPRAAARGLLSGPKRAA
ncbi:MAG: orotidine-5'-phosphate decarboxylase [Geminicoccaceae bacterium]|nr:orotidine-5'-phosphate decarboxylase [Geminicoccaceae bacterium]